MAVDLSTLAVAFSGAFSLFVLVFILTFTLVVSPRQRREEARQKQEKKRQNEAIIQMLNDSCDHLSAFLQAGKERQLSFQQWNVVAAYQVLENEQATVQRVMNFHLKDGTSPETVKFYNDWLKDLWSRSITFRQISEGSFAK